MSEETLNIKEGFDMTRKRSESAILVGAVLFTIHAAMAVYGVRTVAQFAHGLRGVIPAQLLVR